MFSVWHKIFLKRQTLTSNLLPKVPAFNSKPRLHFSEAIRNEFQNAQGLHQSGTKISFSELKDAMNNDSFIRSERELANWLNIDASEVIDPSNLKSLESNYAAKLVDSLEIKDLNEEFSGIIFSQFNLDREPERIIRIKVIDEYLKSIANIRGFNSSPSVINFYLISLLTLLTTDSHNLRLIGFCQSRLLESIRLIYSKDDEVSAIGYEEIKELFRLYFLNQNRLRFYDKVSTELNNYFATLLKVNTELSEDFRFQLDILGLIKNYSDNKKATLNPQLESHEVPFANALDEKHEKQREKIIQVAYAIDITQMIKTNIVEKMQHTNEVLSLSNLNTCLEIIRMTSQLTQDNIEIAISALKRSLNTNKSCSSETLLNICLNLISLMKTNLYFYRETIKHDLKSLFDRLSDTPLDKNQAIQIYSIFRATQTLHQRLLKKIEGILKPNQSSLSKGAFLSILFFYSSIPASHNHSDFYPDREININVKKNLRHLSFENVMDLIISCFQLNFEGKVKTIDYLPTLDGEAWSQIFSILIEVRIEKLNPKEKLKYFRVLNVLSLTIEEAVFDSALLQEKKKVLAKNFTAFASTIESEFQLDVEKSLIKYTRAYAKERLIQDLFYVDFFIPKRKILEVNGPTHYFIVFSEDKIEYLENRSTQTKRQLLEMLGFQYFDVPFYEWLGLEEPDQKTDYLAKKLKSKNPSL